MSGAISRDFEIVNRLGLHARAAAKFVQTANGFSAAIRVRRDDLEVDGKSIMGVLMLAAAKGSTITVTATGTDAEAALEALGSLIAERFGEEE